MQDKRMFKDFPAPPTIGDLKSKIKSDPANVDLRFALAKLYERQDMADEALTEYKELVKLAPGNYAAHFRLGMFYLRHGKENDALAEFQMAAGISPDRHKPLVWPGNIHFKNKSMEPGIKNLLKSLAVLKEIERTLL